MCAHYTASLPVAGAKLLWGGEPLKDHTIPECYGAVRPTAVFVPLLAMRDPAVFKLVTTEVFGPFQVISEFEGERINLHFARAWPVGWMTAATVWRTASATVSIVSKSGRGTCLGMSAVHGQWPTTCMPAPTDGNEKSGD
jgi:1-pyrroline-5-carboxylate dehydrogenase